MQLLDYCNTHDKQHVINENSKKMLFEGTKNKHFIFSISCGSSKELDNPIFNAFCGYLRNK